MTLFTVQDFSNLPFQPLFFHRFLSSINEVSMICIYNDYHNLLITFHYTDLLFWILGRSNPLLFSITHRKPSRSVTTDHSSIVTPDYQSNRKKQCETIAGQYVKHIVRTFEGTGLYWCFGVSGRKERRENFWEMPQHRI